MVWNIHPLVVHFPVALWITAFVFEVGSLILKRDSWHRTAQHVYVMAVLTTPLAVISGIAEEQRHHLSHPVVTMHKNWGLFTLGLGFLVGRFLSVVRRKNVVAHRRLFITVLALAVCCVSLAGFFGGKLVYEYAIGVQ